MNFPVRRGTGGGLMPRPVWGMWDPWRDFEDMWSQMGRYLEQAAGPGMTMAERGGWTPTAEMNETDDAYVIKAEMPGIPRDDIEVELKGNELCITGEMDEKSEGKMLTRRRGSFCYRTSLPGSIDSEHVEADLDDGILTVRVPKSEAARPYKIPVAGNGGESKAA
ncbi:Hsp20/alpha crystallin family protein [Streptomyces fradiae]|uniref:Hsp20/alpha crystallin family protein n=1 Tax=Streptomyces fradiae TaxID=1906 RepID=UPI003519C383